MSPARTIIVTTFDWQGITVEVTYEPNWLNVSNPDCDLPYAHLEIRTVAPERAPLPITETGYKSHFLHPYEIEEFGGPVAYAEAWLNEMAKAQEWLDYQTSSRQLSLF
jgi:hypothetical protein